MDIEIGYFDKMAESGSGLLRIIQNDSEPTLDLLIRESVQNSLDAASSAEGAVNVDYITGTFDCTKLSRHLKGISSPLQERYPGKNDFLAIQDSNTTGLTGELDPANIRTYDRGNLAKLVYDISSAQEKEGAGGSWGLGKTVYYRVGIGLVFFYSRIRIKTGEYESRLAVTLVENEKLDRTLINKKASRNQLYRGVAWWGKQASPSSKSTRPVTDEKEIRKILAIFGLTPYEDLESGTKTGTTIIIPYIDKDRLLENLRGAPQPNMGRMLWYDDFAEALKIIIQKWYAPRIDNTTYIGPKLKISVDDEKITRSTMEPVFQIVQALYNRAYTRNQKKKARVFRDILKDVDYAGQIKVDEIKLNSTNLEENLVGSIAYFQADKNVLQMKAPFYSPAPYIYLNEWDDTVSRKNVEGKTNKPIVCFTRQPGMIINYRTNGDWAERIPVSDADHYLMAVFVLHSTNQFKTPAGPTISSLEEYIRRCETADHLDWADNKNIVTQKLDIVRKIQNNVTKKITKSLRDASFRSTASVNTGLSKMLSDVLMPPEDYGNAATAPRKKGHNGKSAISRKRESGPKFVVDESSISYKPTLMEVPVIYESPATGLGEISISLTVQNDTPSAIQAAEWRKITGLNLPCQILKAEVECSKSGSPAEAENRMSLSNYIRSDSVMDGKVRGRLLSLNNGQFYSLILSSDGKTAVKAKIKLTIKLLDRDIRPALSLDVVK